MKKLNSLHSEPRQSGDRVLSVSHQRVALAVQSDFHFLGFIFMTLNKE